MLKHVISLIINYFKTFCRKKFNQYFFIAGKSGYIRILELRIQSRSFYHCATGGTWEKNLSKTYEALHYGSWFAWRERRERYKRLGSVSPQFALSWSRLTNKPFYT